ncbi:MAG: glycoside hydrolase family 2 [Lachnospiraceae bacterium]|nr:glycoside hydrolase family 2 [Lachnospiraceae bacterium]
MKKKTEKITNNQLFTEAGEALPEIPWNVYPRPQMRREEWLCLNGAWDFYRQDKEPQKIIVPFCPESLLSGIREPLRYGEALRYERKFTIPDSWRKKRILLHLGAVNRVSEIRVNGRLISFHLRGYLPITEDITRALLPGENTVSVSVVNDLFSRYALGKQKVKRGGMWYTPVSGIWQTVWLEPVPEHYIDELVIESDMKGATIRAEGVSEGTVRLNEKRYLLRNGEARIEPEDPHLWSPEDPYLYEFTLNTGEDRVTSYFALREIRAGEADGIPRILLNGKPYFFNGLLDQGYYSDGLFTPADPKLFEEDILKMKALGFNTLRKHIKVEAEQFYYDCDRLGMVVFQDMVNHGEYHYFRDTVLPTLGFKKRKDRRYNRDEETRREFLNFMEETVFALRNHPSILYWTIFNEGWGQFDADEAYRKLRALDKSRLIDATSGWFRQEKSDVESEHIYFKKLKLGKKSGRPQVLSEFGGFVYKIPEHSFNLDKTYGYKLFATREEFAADFRRIYLEEVIPLAKQGLSAAIYTQLSDVEDETNGLLTYDRRVQKLEASETEGIIEALQAAVNGTAPEKTENGEA